MRLGAKILSGFLILALMLLVAGAWSIYQLSAIGTSVQKLLDDNYRSINAGETMLEALEREDSAVLLLMLGKWKEGRDLLASADEQFCRAYETAAGNLTVPGEIDYVNRIQATYKEYKDLWSRPIVDTDRQGNLQWYLEETNAAFKSVKMTVNALIQINEESLYGTASDLKNRAGRAVIPGTVATISALVFSLLFAYLTHRFIVVPIVRITEYAEECAKTGKQTDLEIQTEDEIAQLAQAVKALSSRTPNRSV